MSKSLTVTKYAMESLNNEIKVTNINNCDEIAEDHIFE